MIRTTGIKSGVWKASRVFIVRVSVSKINSAYMVSTRNSLAIAGFLLCSFAGEREFSLRLAGRDGHGDLIMVEIMKKGEKSDAHVDALVKINPYAVNAHPSINSKPPNLRLFHSITFHHTHHFAGLSIMPASVSCDYASYRTVDHIDDEVMDSSAFKTITPITKPFERRPRISTHRNLVSRSPHSVRPSKSSSGRI